MMPVIFDLDGTLVDSAEGILSSFQAAFSELGMHPCQPLDQSIIGPPLQPTLKLLSGSDDPALLAQLTAAFKTHYDSNGYRLTRAYGGIETLLTRLRVAGVPLFVATNKRHIPTVQIMDFLGWHSYFQATVSLESISPTAPNKADLIRHLLHRFALPANTLYVGDRNDDEVAATQAGIPFFHAIWGYEVAVKGIHASGDIGALLDYILQRPQP